MDTTHMYEIGQTVIWRGGWGSRAPRTAVIVLHGEKNGMPVYDLDNGHWAYEYQLNPIEDIREFSHE